MLERNISKFDEVHPYGSLGEFFAARPRPGLTTIQYGGSEIDLLHIDRGANTTIICFHAALARKKVTSYPLFSARRMTSDIDANIICVSDPVLALGGELGWFAGTRTQPLQRDLPNVLRHFLGVLPPPAGHFLWRIRRRLRQSLLFSWIPRVSGTVNQPADQPSKLHPYCCQRLHPQSLECNQP